MDSADTVPVWSGELVDSPLGVIWTAVSPLGLVAVDLWGERTRFETLVKQQTGSIPSYEPAQVAPVLLQLAQYLAGERQIFDLALDWRGITPFQRQVLEQVLGIPYGQTRSYGDIARALGRPGAVRAVGRANAGNPMPLVIPCHRVLGADGRLHGYSAPGGLETKAWLLRREGSWLI